MRCSNLSVVEAHIFMYMYASCVSLDGTMGVKKHWFFSHLLLFILYKTLLNINGDFMETFFIHPLNVILFQEQWQRNLRLPATICHLNFPISSPWKQLHFFKILNPLALADNLFSSAKCSSTCCRKNTSCPWKCHRSGFPFFSLLKYF